ncbi:ATPase [Flavobacteriaceae bacterium MHTCC 0001]
MDNFNKIQIKLEQFIKRYHTNELLKGAILFFATGLLYFLFTLLVEHFLWLNTTARTFLFWTFILVELALLTKFIVIPLSKLFKLKAGIDYQRAAKIIGKHFSEVDDKLLNIIQLNDSKEQSELLLASIEQKAIALKPVPFKLAISFKTNLQYLKYAVIPIIILLLVYATGNFNWFSDSYKRVVDYKTAYEPPAPFQFFIANQNLQAIEGKDYRLLVRTAGNIVPDNAKITFEDETYYLQQTGAGEFEYIFSQPRAPISFYLSANEVYSKPYELSIMEVPLLLSFEMELDYPNHTKKKNETLKSTGNAVVPEGTTVTWKVNTKSTDNVLMYARDTVNFTVKSANQFKVSKRLFKDIDYTISTSNSNLRNYENLSFAIDVVKDEYPEMNIQMKVDSLDLQTLYFYGQVSDDYGLSKLQLVYYPTNAPKEIVTKPIALSNSNVVDFITAFPDNLNIEPGISYELYFQVYDNDKVNNFKSRKSEVFQYRKRTSQEEETKQLEQQGETIKDLNKSLQNFSEQKKRLDELTKTGREKKNLSFNEKKKLASFLKRQKQQDEMMKNFNKRMKDNLEEFEKDVDKEDSFKKELKERLKENEEQLKKNEKLLEQIEKFQDKINNEQLVKKLEEVAKQNKNKERSLEQLLELTKRFYVEKKLEKLVEDLNKIAKEQEELSNTNKEENTKEKQEDINKKFEEFQKEIEELQKESKALKKPIDIPRDKIDEKEVIDEQQKATEALEKNENTVGKEDKPEEENTSKENNNQNQNNAKKSQQKAAQKMKEMSSKMKGSMQSMSGEQMQEDIEMLRQILDNLVLFSFDEEQLMGDFKAIDLDHSDYAPLLKKQSYLKEHFEHIDDSLFALSLRQPKLSEKVNKEIAEVYFNIDKALDRLAQSQIYQGVSNQQFAITATNNLADLLSDILDNMQESMSMSMGQGGQGDMQLPDIIMSQDQLNKMMEQGMKQGQKGQPNKGKGNKEGKGQQGKESKNGKDGDKGEKGNAKGEKGKDGQGTGGEGEGTGFDEEGLLYEIYQRQQQLREALDKRLRKEGKGGIGNRLTKQMEDIEMDLLNRGFTNQTLQKMTNLKHQLLKLDNATFEQGEEERRESNTNTKQFNNTTNNQIPKAKQYFQTTEILNRQALPLQQVYKKKVQKYFKKEHD